MSHGLRWSSELDVNKTTARIAKEYQGPHDERTGAERCQNKFPDNIDYSRPPSMSGVAHAAPSTDLPPRPNPASQSRPLTDWTGCAVPKADGKYPNVYPLVGLCRAAGLPEPTPEYVFHPVRKWQFDYAFPLQKIAVEVEGGIWRKGGGAHSHPSNIERDIEKYNAAALLGWRVLRYAPEDLLNAIDDLRKVA